MAYTPVIIFEYNARAVNGIALIDIGNIRMPTRDLTVGQKVILFEPKISICFYGEILEIKEISGRVKVKIDWSTLTRV